MTAREEDLSIPEALDRTKGMTKEDFDELHDKLSKPASKKGGAKLMVPETVPTEIVSAESAATPMTPLQALEILNKHADAIRAYAQRSVQDVIEIGRRLAEAKKMLGHGNFLPWIEREFAWSEDTAERLIAIYALQRQIPHVAELALPLAALAALGRSTTPPEAIEAVVEKVHAGEKLTVSEVKATIKEAKARKPRLPSYKPEQAEADQETALMPTAPAPTPKPALGNGFVALAHKHRAEIIDLMRKMTQPERIAFRQTMIQSMTDAMMEPPGGE